MYIQITILLLIRAERLRLKSQGIIYRIFTSIESKPTLHLLFGCSYKARMVKHLWLWTQLPALSILILRLSPRWRTSSRRNTTGKCSPS
jgi:hypothetical protein